MVSAPQLAILFLALFTVATPKFPPLLWDDNDRKTIAEPKEREIAMIHDFIDASFAQPVLQTFDLPRAFRKVAGKPKEAENINALDEVPNSSWYTNRNFLHPMSNEEIADGTSVNDAPSLSGPWTITGCKTQGISPGLRIKDSKGVSYLLKFDPPRYPELATGAEAVGTRIFYAAGYNVPSNTVITFPIDMLVFNPDLPCSKADFLRRISVDKHGKLRALASRFLDGKPKGPFSYVGWREDDPNDVIAHEHRRELRGLKVIASFVNHNDIKQLNTLDMYVDEGGQQYLKHYFIDFGATLGSATIFPKRGIEGHEYLFDLGEVIKSGFTLGLYDRRTHPEENLVHPTIGHIEGATFDPVKWKPNLPIPSFENMTNRDGYWGAKIVAAFTEEQLRAVIKTGQYSDSEAEAELLEILKHRRDKIADYWFRRVAPLDRFRVSNNELEFDDLAAEGGYDDSGDIRYRIETGIRPQVLKHGQAIQFQASSTEPSRIHITRTSPGWPDLSVDVYVQQINGRETVIGVLR